MHYVIYCLLPKDEAETSIEASNLVDGFFSGLPEAEYNDDGDMTSDEGRTYLNDFGDWYNIGGRWGGTLTKARLDKAKLKLVEKEFEKKFGWTIGGENRITEQQRHNQMAGIFYREFPLFCGVMPYWRDDYKVGGCDDDAQIMNKTLWNNLIKEAIKKENTSDGGGCLYIKGGEICNGGLVTEKMINKLWVVVVDFHT